MTDTEIQLIELQSQLYVPGLWQCPKCHFILTKTLISAKTGDFAPDLSREEPCPNDGVLLKRVTWQDHARALAVACESQLDRALKAEDRVKCLQQTVEALQAALMEGSI